jgi:hypothetical protein
VGFGIPPRAGSPRGWCSGRMAGHLIRDRRLGSAVAGTGVARRAVVDSVVGDQVADTGFALRAARAGLASALGADLAPDRLSRGCGFGSLGPGMSSGPLSSSHPAMGCRWKGGTPFWCYT